MTRWIIFALCGAAFAQTPCDQLRMVTQPNVRITASESVPGHWRVAAVLTPSFVEQLRSRGIGILITDHNVRETLGICDRAYILSGGVILEEGTPEVIAASRRARELYLGEGFSL